MIDENGGSDVAGVKPTVIDTFDFPAILSKELIANDGDVTKNKFGPKMNPESTGSEGRTSCEVCTVQEDPAVTDPNLNPEIVMVNEVAGILAPIVVIITNEVLVLPHVPASPFTLLLPAITLGIMSGAKKAVG